MTTHLSRRTVIGLAAPLATAGVFLPTLSARAAKNQYFIGFTDSRGTSSQYHFYPGGGARTGLVVYLDGDDQELFDVDYGSDDYDYPGGLAGPNSIVASAVARGYDVAAVHSPGDDRWWVGDAEAKGIYLRELFQHLAGAHGANTSRLWAVGYSGGSEFITESFFPRFANDMQSGGFIVFGGGDAPGRGVGSFSDHAKETLSLNWLTGTKDIPDDTSDFDGYGHAKASFKYYQEQGFKNTYATWPRGEDHESIITKYFGPYVARVLSRG
ncbi:MAG: hypothetical protein Q4D79_02665 [Propionibacteriaceae bacterium]|nr:hypothetical protein [Propionibacteriaceae bacterium]